MTVNKMLSNLPYRVIKGSNGSFTKLYLNDCLIGIKSCLKANSIDVVVTSPPYNIGIRYNAYMDLIPREDYLFRLKLVGKEINRVLKNDGSFFLNVGNRPKDQWIAWDVANTMRNDFTLQNTIYWIKSISISKQDVGIYPNLLGDVTVGHFKPINSNRFLNDCQEYIFHFTKKGHKALDKLSIGVPYQDKSNIRRWKASRQQGDIRDRGNTWFIPYDTIQKRSERPHPATFPIKLPEMCMKLHGLSDSLVVMDPFLGIGSTAIASYNLGVSFIGFEIDKQYLDEAIFRLNSTSRDKQGLS